MSEVDISPIQITVEFEVKNFFDLPLDKDYCIESPPFPFSRGEYFLRLRPNGDKMKHLSGWTCLYLIKKFSPSQDRLAYTVGIKRADGSIFASHCDHWLFVRNGKGFGFSIALRSELLKHRNEVAPNGNLTIFCVVCLHCERVGEVTKRTQPLHRALSELSYYKTRVKELEEKLSAMMKEKEVNQRKIQGVFHTLSKNFKNLFISGSHGDITIKTKNKNIPAHRAVLAARSSVFKAMLEVDMVENNDGVITIEDCDADSLESFFLFLYGGDLSIVSVGNALGLYYIADKYNMPELKRACSQCLSRELSIDTVCDVARLAALHGETELLDTATDFFSSNMADVISHPNWVSFLTDNTSVANELLMKAAKYVKK